MNERMSGWNKQRINQCMNELMNEWMDEWMYELHETEWVPIE